MKLRLVKLTPEFQPQLNEMMEEWTNADDAPYSIRKNDYRDFATYLAKLDVTEASDQWVPDSTFFCLDEDQNIFVGAVNIRHRLNERLLKASGHIGDGVRPSQRRKGVATKMIGLALEECRRLGINRVLMTCDKGNIGSEKSIRNNGGVLENEIEDNGTIVQRYWIDLSCPHYDFFQHRECEYFPCHKGANPETFSCIFCYCPLYCLGDKCGGSFRYTEEGLKDCSNCLRPHRRENYPAICAGMSAVLELAKKKDKKP